MSDFIRSCIFCGNTGLTNEHVVPDWLKRIIRKSKTDGNIFTLAKPATGTVHQKVRQGNPITRQVRFACKRCNIGWMSDLEEELKPTLIDLIYANEITLNHWQIRRLATWAVKTAMTAEFLHPPTAAIPFDMREYLRLHRQPHPKFNVWIGCYGGEGMLLGMEHHSGETIDLRPGAEPTHAPNAQITVIGLGHLFLEIGFIAPGDARFDFSDQTTDFLTGIWPAPESDLTWPPRFFLDAEGIRLIFQGIHGVFNRGPQGGKSPE